MTENIKEKIYHGISLCCIVLCIWLIGQVAADELFGEKGEEHRPPVLYGHAGIQTLPQEGDGFAVGEERIEQELRKYIPKDLPLEALEVEIGADGSMTLEAEVEKQALLDYLTAMDMELPGQSAAAFLLPERLEFSAGLVCTADPESGLVAVAPGSMTLGGQTVDTNLLPQSFWDGLGQALSRLLLAEESGFSTITFGEGAVYLQ